MKTFETFREIDALDIHPQMEPSCFNGRVRVQRYRITVELIDEPAEIIGARIRKLWEECDNHHHHAPLMSAAKRHGVTLDGKDFGSKRKDGK